MSSHQHEIEVTPEQRDLEIARLQAEKAADEARLADQQKESERQREERRALNFSQTWKAEIGRAGIVWFPSQEELESLIPLTGYALRSSADGRMIQALDENGKEIPVAKVLEKLALKYPNMVRDGTANHLKPRESTGEFRSLSKADFKTLAAKATFVRESGLDVWERMPLHPKKGPNNNIDEMTASDWRKLNLTQKSQIVSEYGEYAVQEILRRR
jgi:hypothetical protein